MNFKEPVRCSAIKKIDNKLHIEVVKINNGAHTYCMKEDTRLEGPFEHGKKPVQRNNKTDWEEVKEKAIKGDLDSIPADIFIKHYKVLKEIKKDYMQVLPRTEARQSFWYWGAAGTGKSSTALREHPGAYMKM